MSSSVCGHALHTRHRSRRFVLQSVLRCFVLCLASVALLLSVPGDANSLMGGVEAYEIDAYPDKETIELIRPRLETLKADDQAIRVITIKDVLIVRVEDKRYCAGKFCLTLVLGRQAGNILTSGLLPKSFRVLPAPLRPSLLANTDALIFADFGAKAVTHLLLGSGFAAILSLSE
jgi:hypothetical protein